ncbi:MAG: AMP-binding protein [Desulfobacteraceae bacterium]|jgi:acetyl-CoA synthetase|nr:AMP-binding protein [Desulfobacteraceae bacterium]
MIKARIPAQNKSANLKSYEDTCPYFTWEDVEKEFSWYGPDINTDHGTNQNSARMNIIAESIDRWAADAEQCAHDALVFSKGGHVQTYSYQQLKIKSCQWAAMLKEYEFKAGDRLIILLPPCPEIFFAMAACARMGVIFCPVFSSSSFYELEIRLESTSPRGILTLPDLVEKISYEFAGQIQHIFLTQGPAPGLFPNEVLIAGKPEQMPSEFEPEMLPGDAPLYLIYTSGSTRPPKGVIHTHREMTGMLASARWVLDVQANAVLWTDADPAWVTGTVYGAFAPWLCGVTSFVQGDPFTAANWYWTLEKFKVSVWYTTPKIIRDLTEAGDDLPSRYDLSALRHIASVGAPLIPDLLYWVKEHLKCIPHDTWWMTETGIICIANLLCNDIKPGSIGKPLPGIKAAILDENGKSLPPLSLGELAIKCPWPGLTSGLWQDNDRFQRYFTEDGWFLTGDIALEDEEGYFYHQGRNDDLLKAGGDKVIGPFEIEQVLCIHPSVAEAAVISKGSEPGKGISYLKAFITLKKGYIQSTRLNYEIKAFLKGNLAPDIMIHEIIFLEKLPKTRSGKLLRRVLRARELGIPGGESLNMQD